MSELPPPTVAPATPNRLAVPALAVGVVAVAAGLLMGVFMLRLHPLIAIAIPLVSGGLAVGLGIAATVAATRRQGRRLALGIVGILLGASALGAGFFGRVFGAEVLGFF